MSGANAGRTAAGVAGIVSVCFGPNIYVSSSPDTSSVSAEPLPVRLISATGSLMEGGGSSIILYICK